MSINLFVLHESLTIAESLSKGLGTFKEIKALGFNDVYLPETKTHNQTYFLIDQRILSGSMYELVLDIKNKHSKSKVIAFGEKCDAGALRVKGVASFIPRNKSLRFIVDLLVEMNTSKADFYYDHLSEMNFVSDFLSFLPNQQLIAVKLLLDGNSKKIIAEIMNIAPSTLTSYLDRVCEKLDVDKGGLVVKLMELRGQGLQS